MKVMNVLDSKIIQVGINMYEAHVLVKYKTIFGRLKTKWVLLENELWAGNLSYFSSLDGAKSAIKLYILQFSEDQKVNSIVFQGIPK